MTDPADTLKQVRAASVQAMAKDQKAAWLRSRGWRRLHGRKQQKWQAPNGLNATLSGACQLQLLADLEAP